MRTKRRVLMMAAGVMLLGAAGCGQPMLTGPLVGTVVGYEKAPLVQKAGPRAILVESEGRTHTLFSLYNDATILVFTDQPCLDADSEVVRAASWVGRDVSIIEVTGPGGDCAAHEQCAMARGGKVGNLISLYDPNGLLRSLYRMDASTAVLVLDEDGFVLTSGSLADFEYFRLLAENMAREAERDRQGAPHGSAGGHGL